MKVLIFGASNSKNSINKTLATYAGDLLLQANDTVELDIIDLNDFEMPIYSIDREKESGIPAQAQSFFDKIGQADALIISYAEHNGSYTAAYKNIFDWASRVDAKVFQDKKMVILATSPGPGGAASIIEKATNSAPQFNGQVKATLSVPSYYDVFDADNNVLTDNDLNEKLKEVVSALN